MPLADLQRLADIQMEEDEREFARLFPADAFVPEEEPPFSDLGCVVYHDPEHRISADLDVLERRVRAEIAPRYRYIRFESLSREDLRFWTPFAERSEEDDYLAAGWGRGPRSWDVDAPAPVVRAGNPAHHRVRQESLCALHSLVLIAQATIKAAKSERPRTAWLQIGDEHILAPICGRVAVQGGVRTHRQMPIVMQDGLLLGCNDFRRRVTIHPSVPSTPNTALMQGEKHLRGLYRLAAAALRRQVAFELADPRGRMGGDFDPAAAALWICQTVMTMRLSAEEVRRRYSRAFFQLGDDRQAQDREDEALRARLWDDYDELGGFVEPRIARVAPSLERRLLTIFHGGPVQPIDEACARGGAGFPVDDRGMFEWSQVEAFVRWIGDLRRTGRAMLGPWTSNMVLQLVDWEHEGEDVRLSTWDPDCLSLAHSAASDALLTDMLPQAAWLALVEAASHLRGNACEPFAVSYDRVHPGSPRPSGEVDIAGGRVSIVGPLLMVPFSAAARWSAMARQLPAENVFYLQPEAIGRDPRPPA